MTDDERKELAIDLEQILVARLRAKGVLLNGAMLNRLEMVGELVAQVATLKPILQTAVDQCLAESR